MNLARSIRVTEMHKIALEDLALEDPKIHNLAKEYERDAEKFNYEILVLWRQRNPVENTKEVTVFVGFVTCAVYLQSQH